MLVYAADDLVFLLSLCAAISRLQVSSEDLLELLGKAVTCAVLSKAGPQRARVLGLLFDVMHLHANPRKHVSMKESFDCSRNFYAPNHIGFRMYTGFEH